VLIARVDNVPTGPRVAKVEACGVGAPAAEKPPAATASEMRRARLSMRTHCEWPDCFWNAAPFFKMMWWLFDFTRRAEVARIGGRREVIRIGGRRGVIRSRREVIRR
jgi:hypothetical protein